MKVVGLIAEYNPFHNGHQYHIEKAQEITNADYVIVIMSGNFVQRGTPAIMPKHLRTEAALKSGASLVLELPVVFSTGSAEYFAFGAVSLLNKLGCVDSICFGSESGDIEVLQDLAKIIHEEPIAYKDHLNKHLRQGNSFPLARQKAMHDYLQSDRADSILSEPNNILGIEYLKSLYRLNSNIKPYTIKRIASHYHDADMRDNYSSASSIRNHMQNHGMSDLHLQIPVFCNEIMEESYQKRYPIIPDDFSLLLKYKLLNETRASLCAYMDVSEDLANRIFNQLNQFSSWEQFCELLKTKDMTYTRISRSLLHILLGIHKDSFADIEYARILGFRKDCTDLLSTIKKCSSIPMISKLTATDSLSENGIKMLEKDIYASNLYETMISEKFKTIFVNEYEHPIVRI